MSWRTYTIRPLDAVQLALRDAVGFRCSVCLKVQPTHEAKYGYQQANGAHGVGYRLVCEACGKKLVKGEKVRHG
jgi:hypothetical protein